MLELISPVRPEIISIDNEHFSLALTLKCEKNENKQIKKDEPAVGEISLTTLTSNTSAALQLLHIDDCPKLTPHGICIYLEIINLSKYTIYLTNTIYLMLRKTVFKASN